MILSDREEAIITLRPLTTRVEPTDVILTISHTHADTLKHTFTKIMIKHMQNTTH